MWQRTNTVRKSGFLWILVQFRKQKSIVAKVLSEVVDYKIIKYWIQHDQLSTHYYKISRYHQRQETIQSEEMKKASELDPDVTQMELSDRHYKNNYEKYVKGSNRWMM